ncbi:MAG: Nif3-like dinuclear metal center hexameric protein [Ferruginibacter sp.]
MKIAEIIAKLESIAPAFLQEDYDNAGLITGNPGDECKGILVSLDATEAVIQEAIDKKCNLVVAHHPIVFRGLKKINGKHYVERAIIKAIRNDIALFAIHTNLDNILMGVNGKIADKIGLDQPNHPGSETKPLAETRRFCSSVTSSDSDGGTFCSRSRRNRGVQRMQFQY